MSVSDALSQSWERTENAWLSCATIVVVAFAWQLAPIAGGLFVETPNAAAQWGWMLFSNAFLQPGWLFGVVAAATFYIRPARITAERLVGKECVSRCGSRGSPYNKKKK